MCHSIGNKSIITVTNIHCTSTIPRVVGACRWVFDGSDNEGRKCWDSGHICLLTKCTSTPFPHKQCWFKTLKSFVHYKQQWFGDGGIYGVWIAFETIVLTLWSLIVDVFSSVTQTIVYIYCFFYLQLLLKTKVAFLRALARQLSLVSQLEWSLLLWHCVWFSFSIARDVEWDSGARVLGHKGKVWLMCLLTYLIHFFLRLSSTK